MGASYDYMKVILNSIKNDNTLMRYLHVESCIDFIKFYGNNSTLVKEWYFINANEIKQLYIDVFDKLSNVEWDTLSIKENKLVHSYYESTIFFLTKDAYTLTNGASIFLTNDVFKIANYCFQQLNINKKELDKILNAIDYNNTILAKINTLEKQMGDEEKKIDPAGEKEKKMSRMLSDDSSSKIKRFQDKIDQYYETMKNTHINSIYIPNTYEHLSKHAPNYLEKYTINGNETFKPFTSTLNDNDIMRVVLVPNVEDYWRLLLICGIGIVSDTMNNEYNVLINELASEQKLFMLIASSDYIYGTNYSFHHGYIGKDMTNCSRQKIIQALGRIGRGQVNQHYSIRMRDDDIINILFNDQTNNSIEAENMNKLFRFNDEFSKTEELVNYGETTTELLNELMDNGWICQERDDTAVRQPMSTDKTQMSVVTPIICDDWEELCL